MHYYQPEDILFQIRVYIFGIINITARVMLQSPRLPIVSPIVAHVSADSNYLAVSRLRNSGTSHIHTIDGTLRAVASAVAAGSGTDVACHDTGISFHVTESAFHITKGACHDTESAFHDTESACHVTGSACHGTESACHVTEGSCQVTGSACHDTGSACHDTEGLCHDTGSASHGHLYQCISPNTFPPVTY